MPLRIVPVFFLVLTLVEIAGFILVGRAIGVAATLALVVIAAIAGVVLVRRQGFGVMTRIREDVNRGVLPGDHLADGAMILLAGILLIIPGFVSDIFGILLFIPAVRRLLRRALMPGIVVTAQGGTWQRWPGEPRTNYLDLSPEPPEPGDRER